MRIAAERVDVVTHPLECGHDIQHADIAGLRECVPGEFAEVQITEHIQAVINGDDHDIAAFRQMRTVVLGVRAGADSEAAAVQPDHHGSLAGAELRCPYVEYEAIFVLVIVHRRAREQGCQLALHGSGAGGLGRGMLAGER